MTAGAAPSVDGIAGVEIGRRRPRPPGGGPYDVAWRGSQPCRGACDDERKDDRAREQSIPSRPLLNRDRSSHRSKPRRTRTSILSCPSRTRPSFVSPLSAAICGRIVIVVHHDSAA